jgi:hypothetical protein
MDDLEADMELVDLLERCVSLSVACTDSDGLGGMFHLSEMSDSHEHPNAWVPSQIQGSLT